MGRNLGYYDSDELDRPELNKCPDCECYFASEACPLCGKICPEEMRAGNRAAVKPQKRRDNSSGRVQFIPWYHTWPCILIAFCFMPLVGIILFFTSPHPRKTKIIVSCVAGGIYLLLMALMVGSHFWYWSQQSKSPVNVDLTRAEYVERCGEMTVERFYREIPEEGTFVTMEVAVVSRHVDDYNGAVYYLCRSPGGGSACIYIRDCNLEKSANYLPGDVLRVYGESAGEEVSFWEDAAAGSYPCLYVAYCEPLRETSAEKESLFLPARRAESLG